MNLILFNKKTDADILFKGLFGGGLIKIGTMLLLIMTGFYIFQISEMTKEVYAIQNYSAEIRKVLNSNRDQEYSFLRSNSLSRVKALIEGSGFEKVNRIHYIKISESRVASK